MGAIVTLAVKDLRIMSRDLLGMFFIFVFPLVMGLLFGTIQASFSDQPQEKSISVAVTDNDASDMSRLFVEQLIKLESLSIQQFPVEQAADQVRKGKLTAFIEIPKGFGETAGLIWGKAPALRLGVDPARAAEGAMLEGMIMQAMGVLIQKRFMNPADMRPQINRMIEETASDTDMPPVQRTIVQGLLRSVDGFLATMEEQVDALSKAGDGQTSGFGPSMEIARIEKVSLESAAGNDRGPFAGIRGRPRSPWDISFPSAIMWGVMACVAGFAVTVAKERTAGTFFRLKIAPITRTHVLAGKALACFVSVLAVVAIMMGLGLIIGIQLTSPGLLILATVCTALGMVGLMMLMSVIGRTEQSVSGAGWAIIVFMCMFGGGMVPLAFMPAFMKNMSHFSLVKWGILSLEGAIWRGFELSEMLLPCGVLIGAGAVCFVIGARILARVDD
ncbi:MAG: ABC transporter permease [Phycisphaerales bacterium]|nr:ABC transporter permease [Phycisphaerales bacterium]